MEFLDMPAELLVKCMEGLSVQDVVNIAQVDSNLAHWPSLNNRDLQTCSVLRQLVLANKAIIWNTWNLHYTVQLPLACDFQSITAQQLFKNASKAMALSRHFAESAAPLEPLLDSVYECAFMTVEDLPGFDDHEFELNEPVGSSRFFIHGTILSFYEDGSQYVLKLHENGSIEKHVAILLNDKGLSTIDVHYYLSPTGLSLFVAPCVSPGLYRICNVSVTEISLADENFGHATYHFRLDISYNSHRGPLFEEPVGVIICDPYMAVALRSGYENLLINWRDRTGTCINQHCDSLIDPSYISYWQFEQTRVSTAALPVF